VSASALGLIHASSADMRRSLRLPDFDYSSAGAYFVTISTEHRTALFATLNDTGGIDLTDVGKMIERWWIKLPQKFPAVDLDAHAVMPDHFHGLVLLGCSLSMEVTPPVSVSRVIQWFKTMTTAEYFRGVKTVGWPRVDRRLWQRSFHERVVRTEKEFDAIRLYIDSNPGALFEHF
jgi:putative transposase